MQSTDAVARRRAVAETVAAAYAANSSVHGVLLAGSVARNLADDFSDVEIDVFWGEPPTDSDRRRPFQDHGWELVASEVDEHEWADSFLVRGVKVDTSQFLVSTIDAWIGDVMVAGDTEPELQVRITALRQGHALHNPALIERWRARTEPYPDVLCHAMVDEGLDFRPRERLDMLAARDDVLMLHSDLVDNVRGVLDTLMGLNRVYAPHPWHKWLDWEIGQLPIAPSRLNQRIRRLLSNDARTAVAETVALVHDTFELVDRHLPGYDTSRRRAAFDRAPQQTRWLLRRRAVRRRRVRRARPAWPHRRRAR